MGRYSRSDQHEPGWYHPGRSLVAAGGLAVTLAAVVLYSLQGSKTSCDDMAMALCVPQTITYSLLDFVVIAAYGLAGLSITFAVWRYVWSRRFVWAALVMGGAAVIAPLFLVFNPFLSFPTDPILTANILFVIGGVAVLVGVVSGRVAQHRNSS